jgi:hypothetical protein
LGKIDGRHEFRRLKAECQCQALDGLQPYGALASLDQRNMGPVKSGCVRQRLLREPALLAQLADALADPRQSADWNAGFRQGFKEETAK